jgi:hypothetical protein
LRLQVPNRALGLNKSRSAASHAERDAALALEKVDAPA